MSGKKPKYYIDAAQSAETTVHAQCERYVRDLERAMRKDPVAVRISNVTELIDTYTLAVGSNPPTPLLTRMSHVILADDLYDREHKAKNPLEYSFFNERELSRSTDEGRGISLDSAGAIATDGRNYVLPWRKARRESTK